ncbi:MAG: NrfD/PsrC family molybdoenzyme membrane anchor subunit, partial [Raoultibacter sp.]
FNPFESLISVGAWFVGGATLLSVGIVAIFVAFPQFQRLFFVMACFGSLLSIATMSYTGLLLSSMVAVDFWNTPLLVLLFIISSLSCGIAATSLVEKFFLGKSNGSFYSGFSAWLTVGEGLVLVAFLASRWFVSETGRQSCELLLSGNFSIVFWVGLIAVGLLLPLVLHGLRRLLDTQALEIISCIGVLVGGVCLRYCVIGAGLHSQLTI